MANNILLASYGTIQTAISTDMNSLANNGFSKSTSIDNSANLYTYEDLELFCTFGSSPTAGAVVEVYLCPSVDGTNFADGYDGSVAPAKSMIVGVFIVRAVTTAQRMVVRGVPLPPDHYTYVIKNTSGQAMAASGNTLKRRPYNLQVN